MIAAPVVLGWVFGSHSKSQTDSEGIEENEKRLCGRVCVDWRREMAVSATATTANRNHQPPRFITCARAISIPAGSG